MVLLPNTARSGRAFTVEIRGEWDGRASRTRGPEPRASHAILPCAGRGGQCSTMHVILRDAAALGEGKGLRFRTIVDGVEREAFLVRYRGQLLAYLNECRHQSLPLDFGDARFFDDEYDAIVCCQHGARYAP